MIDKHPGDILVCSNPEYRPPPTGDSAEHRKHWTHLRRDWSEIVAHPPAGLQTG